MSSVELSRMSLIRKENVRHQNAMRKKVADEICDVQRPTEGTEGDRTESTASILLEYMVGKREGENEWMDRWIQPSIALTNF